MRHQNSGRKFSRSSSHRHAMFRNMVTSLIEHERITTTEPKAKELRRFAEKTISISLRLGDLLSKPKDQRSPAEHGKYIHALRLASRMIRTRSVLYKLFQDVAPRMVGRPGGYTRIIKIGQRTGDAAPMAIIELVHANDASVSAAPAQPGADNTASSGEQASAR